MHWIKAGIAGALIGAAYMIRRTFFPTPRIEKMKVRDGWKPSRRDSSINGG